MVKLLHTADWHLGRSFPSFPEDDQRKLSRARLETVRRVFDCARRNAVDAIVCVGDLFDDPTPKPEFWEPLAEILCGAPSVPTVLVPGNHDPLHVESIWSPTHPLRARLPGWVHIVDRDDFELPVGQEAVIVSRPCRSAAGEQDLALALPARAAGDGRVRIGCVHGSTFDLEGYQTNFPIHRDAGVSRGLDYLAIGDTHSFRDVTPDLPVPTVYPGAPEPMTFDEPGAGNVALVLLYRPGRRPTVREERVGYWRWRDVTCRSLVELAGLLTEGDLDRTVLRLRLDLRVSLSEASEVERMLIQLQGNDAVVGRAGVLVVDRTLLALRPGTAREVFHEDLPVVIRDAVDRLERLAEEATDEGTRERALIAQQHLYRLLVAHDRGRGEAL